jgi:hypothetical protein
MLLKIFEDTGMARAEPIWARPNKMWGNSLFHFLRHGDPEIARKQARMSCHSTKKGNGQSRV